MRWNRLPLGLAALTAGLASPTLATADPTTRLVACGDDAHCVLIAGRRADARAPVRINGREVAVAGRHRWHARVPVASIRAWSAPFARSVEVTQDGVATQADLPIGLLGSITQLASLTVRAH